MGIYLLWWKNLLQSLMCFMKNSKRSKISNHFEIQLILWKKTLSFFQHKLNIIKYFKQTKLKFDFKAVLTIMFKASCYLTLRKKHTISDNNLLNRCYLYCSKYLKREKKSVNIQLAQFPNKNMEKNPKIWIQCI